MAQSVNPIPDSSIIVVKTTVQWNDKSIASWVVPRGCICAELTADRKTKLKVGEGNKHYHQLPYIGGDGGDLSDYYTKEEINQILKNSKFLNIASDTIYPNKQSLPPNGNYAGDIRYIVNQNNPSGDPLQCLWTGTRWIDLGGGLADIDLSIYAKKSEVNPRLDALERVAHTHANKATLDQLTPSVIQNSHTHTNKATLDRLTSDVIENSHRHPNKEILDQTTAPYTIAAKAKLDSIQTFIGATSEHDGSGGLVPAPTTSDVGKVLGADGTWVEGGSGSSYQAGNGIAIDDTSDPDTISVKAGTGLAFDASGNLIATGSAQAEYVAGTGISIDEGDTTTDLTTLQWEQGSINSTTGLNDNTVNTAIRMEETTIGLTSRIMINAMDTNNHQLLWKAAYYDSNHAFIMMTPSWLNYSQMSNVPIGTKYLRVLFTIDNATVFDPRDLDTADISYPVGAGKLVISNTGTVRISLVDKSIVAVQNGATENIVTFGNDLKVTSGTVNITDFNRLKLNITPE